MNQLFKYEQEYGLKFPTVYRAFFSMCESTTPPSLIGTDLPNNFFELKKWAAQILQEHSLENLLEKDDFVFMMHQGYMFWYFKADGDENQTVYSFSEVDLEKRNQGPLKEFLQGILK